MASTPLEGSRPDVRIAITGCGAVSPFGLGIEPLWRGLCAGRAAIGPFDLFDHARQRTHVAGQVPRAAEERVLAGLPAKLGARLSRSDRFALHAALEAWNATGMSAVSSAREAGVFFGSTTGGMYESEHYYFELAAHDGRRLAASRLASQQNNGPADAIARRLGLHGPLETHAAACAAASMAIEAALRSLRVGEVDVALAGGADGLCQLTYAGFNSLRAVDERPCRPFRADRAGLSIGEGAGVLVLERWEHARARGARILAELAGAGSACDAHHMTAPDPEGRGAARAMRAAMADAALAPEDIDFVNAHGTGTLHNDAAEWQALLAVFGPRARELPLTSTKGAIGHLLGSCGGIEAVATLLCLCAREVHPTPGDGTPGADCPADLVLGRARRLERCRAALSLNLAFGGANAALVLRSYTEPHA